MKKKLVSVSASVNHVLIVSGAGASNAKIPPQIGLTPRSVSVGFVG